MQVQPQMMGFIQTIITRQQWKLKRRMPTITNSTLSRKKVLIPTCLKKVRFLPMWKHIALAKVLMKMETSSFMTMKKSTAPGERTQMALRL